MASIMNKALFILAKSGPKNRLMFAFESEN